MDLYDADRAAHMLVSHHLAGQGWRIQWNNSRSAAGRTKYASKVLEFSSLITRHVSNEEFIDTVLHEIAHALMPGAKHGPAWAAKYREIGGTGGRTWSDKAVEAAVSKWRLTCQNCGHITYRNRLTRNYHEKGCWHPACGKEKGQMTIALNR